MISLSRKIMNSRNEHDSTIFIELLDYGHFIGLKIEEYGRAVDEAGATKMAYDAVLSFVRQAHAQEKVGVC